MNLSKRHIANKVSVLSDPFVEAPILLSILFLAKSTAPAWLLILVVLIGTVIPVWFLKYGMRRGFITDWETTEREERHGLNLVCLFAIFLDLLLIYFFGDLFLLRLFLILFVLMFLYTLITFFWKISGHMVANTAVFLAMNLFFEWRFWWLVILIPLVAWARLFRQKHDIWQVIGGVALASLVILCGVSLLF